MNKAKDLISRNLRRLRENMSWTQADLAEKADLSLKMIQKLEYGKTNPSTGTLDALSKALRVNLSEFFAEEGASARLSRPSLSERTLTEISELFSAFVSAGLIRRKVALYLLSKDEKHLQGLDSKTSQTIQLLSKVP